MRFVFDVQKVILSECYQGTSQLLQAASVLQRQWDFSEFTSGRMGFQGQRMEKYGKNDDHTQSMGTHV